MAAKIIELSNHRTPRNVMAVRDLEQVYRAPPEMLVHIDFILPASLVQEILELIGRSVSEGGRA